MTHRRGQPSDEVWSAPESGTVREDTSGNEPSDRGNAGQAGSAGGQGKQHPGHAQGKDDPGTAAEER